MNRAIGQASMPNVVEGWPSALIARSREEARTLGTTLRTAIATSGAHQLVLRCTLLLLLFHGASLPGLQVSVVVLAGMILLLPQILELKPLWWALTFSVALDTWREWAIADNHKYLIAYWTVACTLSLYRPDPSAYLAASARLMVGLVFCFATTWKILAGQYANGEFLYFTFLTDGRVQGLGAAVSGWSLSDLVQFRQAIAFIGEYGASTASLPIPQSPALHAVAMLMSWTTILGEGVIAVVYLLPAHKFYTARHVSLMLFLVATYFLLPVLGFAFVLAVLGLTQCHAEDDDTRLRYLILIGIIQLVIVPWSFVAPA